ncbi:hypothetical protein K439DRAFT_1393155 [Ramaria rubella]|nr:hypothetical protein K439DRAFT_1393155 [Ramaria rubella]
MPAFSETTLHILRSAYTILLKRTAPDQGGLLSGKDPTAFNTADPLRIWIIQVGVIMLTTQLLSLLLRKMRQPRVIAEVLGGILLGPTAFGRIPGFTEHVFPPSSQPYLSLVANIGLVMFLFLVGLEIDGSVIKRNIRLSASVALGGMLLPFGLGSVYSIALYKRFVDPSIEFTHFLLFVGVAFSITAFPVLCRILTELKLLDTTVGVVVLSAGVANDIVGWTLLALSVALVNAASGLTALWVLLACVGWALFLLFPIRRVFRWLAHRTGSIENGPTTFFMTVTMIMVFGSAFFTDVIGVHAIFGGFLAGLIIPREGGLAIELTEKLEDMVSIIFLPLYFTLSGLSTDLGLLNNGITWAYTIGIIALAYTGKFGGCTIAARLTGFQWREAAAIGTLMSCKGLVELIVLNVGLSAGILNTRVFSMFVLEALFLTFMTTPVVVHLYPPKYRKRAMAAGPNLDEFGHRMREKGGNTSDLSTTDHGYDGWKMRFTVVLDRMEHLSSIMTVAQLFRPFTVDSQSHKASTRRSSCGSSPMPSEASTAEITPTLPIIDALRLIELSDRTSAVMKSNVAESLIHTDPLLNAFRTFSELNDVSVSTSLSVVPFDALAPKVVEHARDNKSHLILVSWLPHTVPLTHAPSHHNGGEPHTHPPATISAGPRATNPFDILFNFGIAEESSSTTHSQFVRGIFAQSNVDVALFIDRGRAGPAHFGKQRIFLPFFGGPDDRLALATVIQLCGNPRTSAKIVRVTKNHSPLNIDAPKTPELAYTPDKEKHGHTFESTLLDSLPTAMVNPVSTPVVEFTDTVYGNATTQTRLQSETADNLVWDSLVSPSKASFSTLSSAIRDALTRIEFVDTPSSTPLSYVLSLADRETNIAVQLGERPFVVMGRARCAGSESHHAELMGLLEEKGHIVSEVRKTMGDVATAFISSGNAAGLLVMQAAGSDR